VEVYSALFRATSELLLELGRTRMKATLGLTLVLHTWTRDLRFHPHVHVLATAGGLSLDGKRFVHARKDDLFPVEVMGTWSALRTCRERTGSDPLAELTPALTEAWGGAVARELRWPLALRAGRV
jgi:hypothetical protein